jgi:hypothetical protein
MIGFIFARRFFFRKLFVSLAWVELFLDFQIRAPA